MKKTINYSLFGDNEAYYEGMFDNIISAGKHFPEWNVKVWIQEGARMSVEDFIPMGIKIEEVPKNMLQDERMTRLIPMFNDNEINIFRDADSPLDRRDRKFVDEWLESGKKFHTIRDHSFHLVNDDQPYPILAGMWGVIGSVSLNPEEEKYFYYFMSAFHGPHSDQEYLRDRIWNQCKSQFHVMTYQDEGWKSKEWKDHEHCGRRLYV